MTLIIKKPIEDFEDTHSITRDGRVWSKHRKYWGGKWLNSFKDKYGYLRLSLSKNGKKTNKKIHRLVAQAFIPNPENKPEINHIDGDKTNNYVENLEWVTHKENSHHAQLIGLTASGEKQWCAKLTWEQINEIRENHISKGIYKRKPWNKYNISNVHYYKIIRNEIWINRD